MSGAEVRDQAARDLATTALHQGELTQQSLDTHLANCESQGRERLDAFQTFVKEVRGGFEKQSNSVSRVHARIDRLLWACIIGFGAVILAMAAAVGTLLMVSVTP